MNVNIYNIKDYKNFITLAGYKNKPNSNPNKPNLRKAKMNVNLYFIEDYRKKDDFKVRINKPNFQNVQNERKLNFNKGLQKKRLFSRPKNKPNSNPIKPCPERSRMGQFPKGQNERKIACQKSRPHPCRLSHIFGLQFGLIVAKYSEICNHRFVSDNKAMHVLSSTCPLPLML